ncbi:iron-sulfur cluster assembly scaffold protein [Altererythrobacter luteolus]|uniref:Iron-sulfur cluster assembly scaffold protein n=1 Tax=Pontixanthobacter luteolus TaxID=295089 RepID=A0A6I4V0L8_9SPHN|nr:iron-sulfur cluster assembly scaffold protein [Pontixanthobacter luteolus]MXP46636.1 iron-sulfur cluster assembly scaffold protein [Pontixanthobacter luteolus]
MDSATGSAPAAGKLYSREILSLATELANYPYIDDAAAKASARSRSCGSTLDIALRTNASGEIAAVGMAVTACAVGQAAAAIFALGAEGKAAGDLDAADAALRAWLTRSGEMPDWPGIAFLTAAQEFPGRHDAIRLPWRAARLALSNPTHAG